MVGWGGADLDDDRTAELAAEPLTVGLL